MYTYDDNGRDITTCHLCSEIVYVNRLDNHNRKDHNPEQEAEMNRVYYVQGIIERAARNEGYILTSLAAFDIALELVIS